MPRLTTRTYAATYLELEQTWTQNRAAFARFPDPPTASNEALAPWFAQYTESRTGLERVIRTFRRIGGLAGFNTVPSVGRLKRLAVAPNAHQGHLILMLPVLDSYEQYLNACQAIHDVFFAATEPVGAIHCEVDMRSD